MVEDGETAGEGKGGREKQGRGPSREGVCTRGLQGCPLVLYNTLTQPCHPELWLSFILAIILWPEFFAAIYDLRWMCIYFSSRHRVFTVGKAYFFKYGVFVPNIKHVEN